MSIGETNTSAPSAKAAVQTTANSSDCVVPSRRRFVTGGVAAVPVVASLMSRPAFANMCTVSGTLSGNLSGTQVHCSGLSVSYWAANPKSWPQFSAGLPNPMGSGSGQDCYSLVDTKQLTKHSPTYGFYNNTSALNYQQSQLQGTSFKSAVGVDQSQCSGSASTYKVPRPTTESSGDYQTNLPNQPLTLMQALTSGNDVLANYAAAVLNAAKFGEAYGYSLLQMQALIQTRCADPKLVNDLKLLNSRGN